MQEPMQPQAVDIDAMSCQIRDIHSLGEDRTDSGRVADSSFTE